MAFGELYGHEKAIAILKNAMANNRIAHAYLFYGMEGIGKRTAASAFRQGAELRRGMPSLRRLPILPEGAAPKPPRHHHDHRGRPVHQDRGD